MGGSMGTLRRRAATTASAARCSTPGSDASTPRASTGSKARSRRPRTSPNATHTELVEKIIYLCRNYDFGPGKISTYLQRYHQVKISNSSVWRILKRLEMNRLPASQKH
jgi:IS30 family transposase